MMTRNPIVSILLCGVLSIACVEREVPEDTGATDTTSATQGSDEATGPVTTTSPGHIPDTTGPVPTTGDASTTGPEPTTGAVTTTSDESDVDSGDPGTDAGGTCGFNCPGATDGDDALMIECDVFAQDCPAGEKCAAWAWDGGQAWNGTHCVPVTGAGAPGEPCMTIGAGHSGLDDCQEGAMCFFTDESMQGTCVALCQGSPDAAVCEGDGVCSIASDGTINLCLAGCDPLAQDCGDGQACVPLDLEFVCLPDASGPGGGPFQPCEFLDACDPGNFCNDPTLAPTNCDDNATGCCLPFCELGGAPCPGIDTHCEPYFEEGTAPPGKETLGACLEVSL